MSSRSLEELEARCDILQRRVADRSHHHQSSSSSSFLSAATPHHVQQQQYHPRSSPPRAFMSTPAAPLGRAGIARDYTSSHGGVNLTSDGSSTPPPPPALQHYPSLGGHQVPISTQEVAAALAALEREKQKLEEQLRIVNTHMLAYKVVMQQQQQQHSGNEQLQIQQQQFQHSSSNNNNNFGEFGAGRGQSPTRPQAVTPPPSSNFTLGQQSRAHSPPQPLPQQQTASYGSGQQTEQIYEELRVIRKAREDRENQRRATLQQSVASPYRH